MEAVHLSNLPSLHDLMLLTPTGTFSFHFWGSHRIADTAVLFRSVSDADFTMTVEEAAKELEQIMNEFHQRSHSNPRAFKSTKLHIGGLGAVFCDTMLRAPHDILRVVESDPTVSLSFSDEEESHPTHGQTPAYWFGCLSGGEKSFQGLRFFRFFLSSASALGLRDTAAILQRV